MLVILRQNVDHLGKTGDLVNVSDGYARNYLLPRSLVVAADAGNIASVDHHRRLLEKKRLAEKERAQKAAAVFAEFSCVLARKVGDQDQLFGSVNVSDIVEALKQAGHEVEKKMVLLSAPIKALGVSPVTIKFDAEVSVSIQVRVVKEE